MQFRKIRYWFPHILVPCYWLSYFGIEFTPTVSNIPPSTSSNKNRTGLIVGVVVGIGVLSFLAAFLVFYILRRRKPLTNDDEGKPKIMLHIHDSCQTSFSFLNILEKWNSFLYVMLWYSLLMTSEVASAYSILSSIKCSVSFFVYICIFTKTSFYSCLGIICIHTQIDIYDQKVIGRNIIYVANEAPGYIKIPIY